MSKQNGQTGYYLRKLREEQNLSRELVADRSGIGLRHLAAIELGEKNPSVNSLYRLIRAIGASADRIFYPELDEPDSELSDIMKLLACCNPKQLKLTRSFIKTLLDPQNSDIFE